MIFRASGKSYSIYGINTAQEPDKQSTLDLAGELPSVENTRVEYEKEKCSCDLANLLLEERSEEEEDKLKKQASHDAALSHIDELVQYLEEQKTMYHSAIKCC
ncbi:hypothetical protein AVEN_52853-1 [Araneus ventricosus]|uniref:Uncharacterized protein n=1 Tax=Araneus ventricosus TaxID=182803 RepID=A0A4Y2MI05_ARAVE|nr:hypothetical protein AVEN_53736-1 [Araneus ventricosus]GBN25470.1 hypothetical protein AVEN_52853-1 [Araneus ventricosus]